jgi:predicted nucleic acid binding AN1-type Zn finger protein
MRCSECSKRINITNSFPCSCGKVLCGIHRFIEAHDCAKKEVFVLEERKRLTETLVRVEKEKLQVL